MSRFRCLLAILALACIIPINASFGLAGELSSPSLAFPAGSPLTQPVMAVISDKQYKFLHGNFINSSTTLEYGGDAAALNSFLSRLAACGGEVNVRFAKVDAESAWTLQHSAWGNPDFFQIEVNTSKIDEHLVQVPKPKK